MCRVVAFDGFIDFSPTISANGAAIAPSVSARDTRGLSTGRADEAEPRTMLQAACVRALCGRSRLCGRFPLCAPQPLPAYRHNRPRTRLSSSGHNRLRAGVDDMSGVVKSRHSVAAHVASSSFVKYHTVCLRYGCGKGACAPSGFAAPSRPLPPRLQPWCLR